MKARALDSNDLEALRKDAERYRKIKNKFSPFVLRYYGSRILGGDINRRDVLTPEMDELIDAWTEDEQYV